MQQDSSMAVKDEEINNLNMQIGGLEELIHDQDTIVADLGGNKTWLGEILKKFGSGLKTGIAVAGGVAILILVAEHL